jgi:MFS family permease
MLTVTTAANASIQLGVDPTMRGRVMALYLMCFMGGTPFGAPMIGWVAEAFGPRWGMVGGGAICLISAAGIAIVLGYRRGLRPARVAERMRSGVHLHASD